MYEISVKDHFSAAHRLVDYQGDCSNVHGHNCEVRVSLRREELDGIGTAVDFHVVKRKLKEILDEMDHSDLNDHRVFSKVNPTSERLAKFIYDELVEHVKDDRVNVHRVSVSESPGTAAVYFEGPLD